MKATLLPAAALIVTLACGRADIIAQWNFNDTNSPSTAPPPALGAGAASLVGGTAAAFVGGASTDPGGVNKAWSTTTYPPAAAGNKTAGVRFDVSTEGYESIMLSWSQENTATASRYVRPQCTLDGVTFNDLDPIGIYLDGAFTTQTVSLSALPGAAGNPLFGFRILAEFEDSATGSGANAYVATRTNSAYSAGGAIHFDLVTVSGTPIYDGNDPPDILASIPNQTLDPNLSTVALPFRVLDAEDPACALTLAGASSVPSVVPPDNIVFGGTNAHRTVIVTAGNQSGSSLITIYVFDTSGKSNSAGFHVTVLPANCQPFISALPPANTFVNVPAGPIPFTVWDRETPAASLAVSGTSAKPALVPNTSANLSFAGNGSNRTAIIIPAPGQIGVAPISLTVSDGTNCATSVFAVMVTPSTNVIFYDPFDYPDGSLATNSGFLWGTRSGTCGQCQTTNGHLQLAAAQAEDPEGPLIGAPYAKDSGAVLYASFKLNCLTLPKSTPGFFAHFAAGSTLRGRVYVGATNSAAGCYRLSVANQTDADCVQLAADLHTNTTYTVVTRYNIDTATTTLWLNPTAESDPGVTASDLQTAVAISSFDFREDSGLGNARLLINDLEVGLTFAAVAGSAPLNPIPLVIQRSGNNVILSWTNAAFVLQTAPSLAGAFTNLPATASPFTNPISGSTRFFRLKGN